MVSFWLSSVASVAARFWKITLFIVQFCKHAAAMGGGAHGRGPCVRLGGMLARHQVHIQAEWSNTHGKFSFTPWAGARWRPTRTR
jgi:hypothetical protein